MDEQKCHCNGSSGTDCYYCQGSGIVNKPFHIEGSQEIKDDSADYLKMIHSNRNRPLAQRITFLEFEINLYPKNKKIVKYLNDYIKLTCQELLLAKQPTTTSDKRLYADLVTRCKKIKDNFKRKLE